MILKFNKHHYKYNETAYLLFLVNRIIIVIETAASSSPIIYIFYTLTISCWLWTPVLHYPFKHGILQQVLGATTSYTWTIVNILP